MSTIYGLTGPVVGGVGRVSLLSWSTPCDANGQDSPPAMVSVTIDYDVVAPAAPAATDSIEAAIVELSWGCNDVVRTVPFDLRRGVTVTLPAEHVNVAINYPFTAGIQQPTLNVRATLAFGTGAAATTELRRTVNFGAVNAASESALFEIPRMATFASLENGTITLTAVDFLQRAANDAAAAVLDRAAMTKGARSAEVRQGARVASVFNNTNGAETCRVVFYLGLA